MWAIMSVTALAIAGFGVPLAIAVQRLYQNDAVVRLEREVVRTGALVPASFRTSGDPVELPAPGDGTLIGLYSPEGGRVIGSGPARGGPEVSRAAATGRIADRSRGGNLVVAAPLASNEKIFAVVRAELPRSTVTKRVRRAWLLMVGLAVAVVAGAALIARRISGRLARPVADLAAASVRLGSGDFTARAGRSGIKELDMAASNLDVTAERLGVLVGRERAFSADASHQLRTPLTGLRLHLEAGLATPTMDPTAAMTVALGEVDRLEQTIDDLLALARDVEGDRGPFDLGPLIEDLASAWHGRLAASGRPLRVAIDTGLVVVGAAPSAVRHILGVLIANAAEHGAGTVRIRTRKVAGGVAIDVTDEGPGITGDKEVIFRRRSGATGRGIGLALARSLAEAEDARLTLLEAGPGPTFSLLLQASDDSDGHGS